MVIGIPKEIKDNEYRVGLMPEGVREVVSQGHEIFIEKDLGKGIDVSDEDYIKAGAKLALKEELFKRCDIIAKLKELELEELRLLREGQIFMGAGHLASDLKRTQELLNTKCIYIAYETITGEGDLRFPLLQPMSEITGKLAVTIGANCLLKANGGSGVFIGGATGVNSAKVLVLGAGVVGRNAAEMAVGMGAKVVVIDKNFDALAYVKNKHGNKVSTLYSNKSNIEKEIKCADLVVSSVLIPGAKAPKLVTREMVASMKKGSVIVDVAIDQGGSVETSRETSHSNPTYVEEGIVHYCVPNMPGTVAKTSAHGVSNSVLPIILEVANKGEQAFKENKHILNGLHLYKGKITHKGVADSLNLPYSPYKG